MCGFTGIIGSETNWQWDEAEVLRQIAHRGPDADGIRSSDWFKVGHTRLSIIDLDPRANQPMQDSTGRYLLVFNGEIYNYRQLKEELRGVNFQTSSDTEVLLHLLITKGKKALDDLNGCFSFCFIDTIDRTAIIARDRFGINPLYYSIRDHAIAFSSSFKSLTTLMGGMQPSALAVSSLAQFSFVHAPHSCDDRILKLEPGHLIEVTENHRTTERWYQPEVNAEGQLLDLLRQSVSDRLIADVPVATFLSGGLDSSLITALAAEVHPGITAYSIGFENEYLDESKWAQQVAQTVDCDHRLLILKEDELLESVEAFLNQLDEPFGDSSALAVWTLSRMAGENHKVCLSGDGADELFGGYNRHRAFWHWNQNSLQGKVAAMLGRRLGSGGRESQQSDWKRKLSAFAELRQVPKADVYAHLSSFADQNTVNKIFGSGYEIEHRITAEGEEVLQQYLLLDQQFVLPNDMLHKVDSMSMAHSLEVRTPFLDHRLVEWVNAQPSSSKYNGATGKIMLREAAAGLVPLEIIDRRKSGFEIPVETWLRGPLEAQLTEGLQVVIDTCSWVSETELLHAQNELKAGESVHASMLWSTMVLGQWLKRN